MGAGSTEAAEQAVVQHALAQGLLTFDQLRAALLLQEQLRSTDPQANLLGILRGRYLPATALPELTRVWREALQPGAGADDDNNTTLPPPSAPVDETVLLLSGE
ncbi:hypothetical protein OAX78_00795, partial [Planctomycetota bacterium]|nr:hypothetical protein [Planctomycetota bacterium]